MQEVYQIMNDIADCSNVSGQHIQYLGMQFQENPNEFWTQLEKCYLKLIKHFSTTNKTIRKVFETATEKFTTYLVKKWLEQSQVPAQKTRKQISSDQTRKLLTQMICLFAEGLDSTQFNTRICCGRFLFMVLRSIPPEALNQILEDKSAYEVLNNTVGLFRNNKFQKTGKTQKGLAVKLGSYLQHISYEDKKNNKLKDAIIALKAEMVKTICEEEKKELRLDALTNTELNDATLPFIIIRIRDTDTNVRLQVFKKLIKNKYYINKLQILDAYQIVYDGLRNSCTMVVEQCEEYLKQSFASLFISDQIQEERIKSNRKSIEELNKYSRVIDSFLSFFQIDKTLAYPQLYSSLMDGFKCMLKIDQELGAYFRDLFKKLTYNQINGSELSLLKVLCQVVSNKESKDQYPQELALIVDHNYPEGVEFAKLFSKERDLLSYYELLQMAQLMINCDEMGRKALLDQLKIFISQYQDLKFIKLNTTKFNEIYEDVNDETFESRWFAQHHFEMPIVRSYFDLMIPTVKVIKLLVTSQEQLVDVIFETIQELRSINIDDKMNELQQQLQTREQEQEKFQKELDQLNKKRKQNAQTIQLNEQVMQQNQQQINQLQKSIDQLINQMGQIDIHSLYLLDALFNQFDITKIPDRMFARLKNLVISISDKYTKFDQFHLAKKLSFRCLGYIPLFGLDIGGSTIATLSSILEQTNLEKAIDDPITITALRSILDALLMYDGDQQWILGSETYTRTRILQTVTNFAFKTTGILQSIALEGISKLLIHQKIPKPQIWIALFLFLWFDTSLRSQQLPLQIVTSFFKLFITSSLEFLISFEQGLEIYFSICCYLHYSKDQILNPNYLQTQQWQEMSMTQAAQAGIKMMSYKSMKQHPSISEFGEKMQQSSQNKHDYFIGPQERFMMYLSKLISDHNNIILKSVLSSITKQQDFLEMYDFMDNENKIMTKPIIYEVLIQFIEQAVERLEKANQDVKNENSFLKVLQEEVGQMRNDESYAIKDKVNQDFEIEKNDVNQLVKDMKKAQLIIQGSKNDIEFGKQVDDEGSSEEDVKKKKRRESPETRPRGKRRR